MALLNVPEEVIESSLLPYLKWNDLLRFRRVCRRTRGITDGYLTINPDLAPEIEINENDKSFGAFLDMNIPTTRIFLNNLSGEEFYRKGGEDAAEFLRDHGPLVKHLRVHVVSAHVIGKEWDFLETLVNLQSFEAGSYWVLEENTRAVMEDLQFCENNAPVPDVFRKLNVLKIGQKDMDVRNVVNRVAMFGKIGRGLEEISLPFNLEFYVGHSSNGTRHTPNAAMIYCFRDFTEIVDERAKLDPPASNLRVIDFANYHDITFTAIMSLGSHWFLELCAISMEHNVKLRNVGSLWFDDLESPINQYASPNLGLPVLSLVNLYTPVFLLSMPNLESIEIRQASKSIVGSNWREMRPDWQSLKRLDINVDSDKGFYLAPEVTEVPENTRALYQFFFQDIVRPRLTELCIKFTLPDEDKSKVIPKMGDVLSSCPNLKKLTLINWPGTNKALIKIFYAMRGLEEITLNRCKDVGNVTFVGLDTRSPVFFNLPKLKKLSLKGLDQMPKISNLFFSLVLRHLKLSHLTLTSDAPLTSITPVGILSLLEGSFAETIEKFPFKDWALANVSTEEFMKLEEKFRSYNML